MTSLAPKSTQPRAVILCAADGSATSKEAVLAAARFAALPGTVAAGTSAMAALRRTLPSLDGLVTATRAATPGMAGFLRRLRGLLVTATPVLRDVAAALAPQGPSLVAATARLPALQRALEPATRHSLGALRQLTPMLAFARPYTPDLASALRGFGQAAGPYDAVGHYVRGVVGFGAFSFDGGDPGTLTRVPPGASLAHVQQGRTARCPGAATQAPADGSAPWVPPGGNCDPGQVPP